MSKQGFRFHKIEGKGKRLLKGIQSVCVRTGGKRWRQLPLSFEISECRGSGEREKGKLNIVLFQRETTRNGWRHRLWQTWLLCYETAEQSWEVSDPHIHKNTPEWCSEKKKIKRCRKDLNQKVVMCGRKFTTPFKHQKYKCAHIFWSWWSLILHDWSLI